MLDVVKLQELRDLASIPCNDGEQFIVVSLNLTSGQSGVITFGFRWKTEMGERIFHSLDEATQLLTELRKRANL